MEDNVETCSASLSHKQYFENLCLDLIVYIELSPNPAVAADIVRCIVCVAQNLSL